MQIADTICVLSITADFWREHPGLLCLMLVALSITVGYFVFRPLSWRQFLGRCPLFLVTGGAFLLTAIAHLPEAFPKPFEWYLGHSIYEMVYERQSSGTVFGELWTNRWWGYVGIVFYSVILVSVMWAILNLSKRHAVRPNVAALILIFGWVCFIIWATSMSILF